MHRSSLVGVCLVSVLAILSPSRIVQVESGNLQQVRERQVELPETPSGRCAAAYFKAFNSGSDDQMRAFLQKYRTESYIKRHPMKGQIEFYRMVYEGTQSLKPVRIVQATDYEIIVIARAALRHGLIRIRFKVDSSEPHHMLALTIDWVSEEALKSAPVDDQIIESTIDSVVRILRESYVYPEKGEKMADMLIRYKSEGRYAGITNERVFAQNITEDLYALSRDRHLSVSHGSPASQRPKIPGKPHKAPAGGKGFVEWPDTPAGRATKLYFQVYDTGGEDKLRQFIKERFSQAALKRQPLEEAFAFHSGMRSKAGKLIFHSVSAFGDFAVEVSLEAEKTGWARLRIEVSPEPPHGIETFEDITPSVEDIRNNYGFRKVEVLPNNIGYVRFDQFHSSEQARQIAAAALAFVINCDALIFDLRYNGGGTRHLNQFISSYLFDRPVHLGGQYSRLTDDITEWRTFETIPGRRFSSDIPVYILTSSNTFSAAEAFAHWLKDLKRAIIVGESTGGGAHPVYEHAVNDRFWMRVPFARAISPVSKTDWEGTGVKPDIQVPANQALEAACEDAVKRINTR